MCGDMYRIPNVAKIVPTEKTRSRNLKLETRQIPELGFTKFTKFTIPRNYVFISVQPIRSECLQVSKVKEQAYSIIIAPG